ncbi:MAG TPA: hemolysin family protein [Kouleothrix sp.]|uniref:hemolysin family protein n=1 Tax=Kouleothrix sp. TaxID=2779161 RepID=UPI002CAEC7BF|nr:hemolysin family protein [Kouleothrix sp.]
MESSGAVATLLRLAGVLVLVALNGFFVAAEFALVGSRRTRLEQLASAGNATAALGRRMQEDLDRYIAAAQLGITLASLALGWIGESTVAALVDPPIEALVVWLLGNLAVAETLALSVSHAVGIAVSFFVITSLHIVLGEQAPKVFAIRAPENTALFIARPLALFNQVFGLIIRFLDWATELVLRLVGISESGGHTKVHSADELRLLVEESGEAGVLDEEEQEMLINVFAFADRPAYQAMLPRTEVVTIDHEATVHEFLDRFAETGHTRFPVLGPGGVDDVRGIISAKDLLVAMRDGSVAPEQPIGPLIRPAFFTPESKRIGDLLQELRAKHIRMAILIDEYGGMAGVVTMEDLVEEIVGDLDDELGHAHDELKTIDEQTTVVEGQMRVEDVNEELDLNIPAGDYETLAGFILARLGRLPANGDTLLHGGTRLTVLEMQGPRIKRIEIKRGQ